MLVISIEFYIMQVSLLLPSNEFYVTQVSILLPANLDFITRRLPKDFVKGHFFTAKALQNHPRKIKYIKIDIHLYIKSILNVYISGCRVTSLRLCVI